MNESSSSDEKTLSQQQDLRLMQRLAARDSAAMQQLYDRYAPYMLGVAIRILNDRSAAEDLLIDVFFEIWQKADRFDASRGSVSSYLLMLTRSRAIDRKRSGGKMKLASLDAGIPESASGKATPPTDLVADERAKFIREAMGSLEPAQRQCIECSFFDGLSHSEIAEKLNKPLGTVKTMIRNGLIRMRDMLKPVT